MENKRDLILIVDDQEINRVVLRGIFENTYRLLEAENGQQALLLISQYHDRLAAVLLDIVMPVMDGYQVMEEAGRRGLLKDLPVVVITAENSAENEMRVFDLGASDIIAKPFEPHVVLRRVRNIVDLSLRTLHQDELIEQQAARLRESNAVMIDALSSIIEYRSLETGQHIRRIGLFTRTLLEDAAKTCPEYLLDSRALEMIASAASLHDIGKIAIPDAILNKPGRLTPEERAIMETHAAKGAEMLTTLNRMGDQEYLRYAYNICRYHHERWDGRGYPDGLKGDAIPLCAQAVGIADCYDALTNDRVYKKAIPPRQAVNMILNGECGMFSPRLMESLKHVEGTFARLTEKYIDTVSAEGRKSAPAPAVTGKDENLLDTGEMAQMKYYTLLRQLDSTVMEVDFLTGIYHVVYLAGEDFRALCSGATFEDAYRGFVKYSVHPDDRAELLDTMDRYVSELFSEGLMRRARSYRVFSASAQQYVRCRATLLRVDTGLPHQRRGLILWQPEISSHPGWRPENEEQATARLLQNAIGSVQRCRMDKFFTLDSPSERLLSFLGYTAEEMESRFQNRYLNLIYPADRSEAIRQVRSQLNKGNTVELEYRLMAKDGRNIWVLDKTISIIGEDGEQYLYYILIDITQSRQTQRELRRLTERCRILMEQTSDIIFEWDVEGDVLDLSRSWRDKFGYTPIRENASKNLVNASHLHPDDIAQLSRIFSGLHDSKPLQTDLELRIADAEGRYRLCRIRQAPQCGENGQIASVIGVISVSDAEEPSASGAVCEGRGDSEQN